MSSLNHRVVCRKIREYQTECQKDLRLEVEEKKIESEGKIQKNVGTIRFGWKRHWWVRFYDLESEFQRLGDSGAFEHNRRIAKLSDPMIRWGSWIIK